MKLKLTSMAPMNMKELKEAIISMWDTNITHDHFKKLSVSMRRVQLVLDSKVNSTKYEIFLVLSFLNF